MQFCAACCKPKFVFNQLLLLVFLKVRNTVHLYRKFIKIVQLLPRCTSKTLFSQNETNSRLALFSFCAMIIISSLKQPPLAILSCSYIRRQASTENVVCPVKNVVSKAWVYCKMKEAKKGTPLQLLHLLVLLATFVSLNHQVKYLSQHCEQPLLLN